MQRTNETFLTIPGVPGGPGVVRKGTVRQGTVGQGAVRQGVTSQGVTRQGVARRVATAMFGMAALLSVAATQASAMAPGDKVTNHFRLGAIQVPLPAGEWTVAGTGKQTIDVPAIGAYGTIQSAVLFMTRGTDVVAILEANANQLPVNDGWGRTKACALDQGQLHLTTRYKSGWQTGCIFVQASQFGVNSAGPTAWTQAKELAKKSGLKMPANWLTAGFRSSDRHDLVDARYHFNPSMFLGATAASLESPADWSADAVKADPLRDQAVQALVGWANGFDAFIDRGMVNQFSATAGNRPGLMPEAAAYTAASPRVDAKMRDLDGLYQRGQIKWDTYQEQSKAAVKEAPVVSFAVPLLSNAVRKNISFRTFGTVVDYAIGYMVTANVATSIGIALSINSTDSVWFVLNDQYWDDYYARLNTHDSERLVDFTYIGGGPGA